MKMLRKITNAFKGLIDALTKIVLGIFNAVFGLFKAIFNAIKFVINGIVSIIVGTYQAIASVCKKVINSFKPVYRVTFTMYHVIPGMPVQENVTVHAFARGASKEAKDFYYKVVEMTMKNKIAPTVVMLKKGKKTVQTKQFGPIEDIKKFRIAA